MSVSSPHIVWLTGGFVDRVLARVTRHMRLTIGRKPDHQKRIAFEDLFNEKKLRARNIVLNLPQTVCFATSLSARTSRVSDQVKVLKHESGRLSPLGDQNTVLIAQKSPDNPRDIQLMQIRSKTLKDIEAQVQKLGLDQIYLSPSAHPDWQFTSPDTASKKSSERRLVTLGISLLLAGAWLMFGAFAADREVELLQITNQETAMRAALLQRLDTDRQLTALDELAATHPEEKTPQGRLATLAQITEANSDETWWQAIEMQEAVIRLAGRSNSAAGSLTQIKAAFPDALVIFSDNVSDTSDGDQSFTIEISPGDSLR